MREMGLKTLNRVARGLFPMKTRHGRGARRDSEPPLIV